MAIDSWNIAEILLLGYAPGAILGAVIWLIARKSAPMPLYIADITSLFLPLVVWAIMMKYQWTLVPAAHSCWEELVLLGWFWGVCFAARLLIPRFTHKLRFRLAAIHVGSLSVLAAILLALFFSGFPE
ncbi:hypothetical protein SDC9_118137 [bioreactor metagenome]|uniref:Uncharacterized protein n=1 Tax=bioreactor metagenome TaxID=1076179 RepID=A0A645C8R7_9ZZZZ